MLGGRNVQDQLTGPRLMALSAGTEVPWWVETRHCSVTSLSAHGRSAMQHPYTG